MFTWICPKCGSEVPPSYDDCPNCSGKLKAPAPSGQAEAPPPPSQAPATPAAPAPPPAPRPESAMFASAPAFASAAPPAPHKSSLPPWLVTILVAGGLIAVVGGGLYLYNQKRVQPTAESAQMPLPGRVESSPTKEHPYAKYLELAGLRITEDAQQKARVGFIVINHSGADLPELDITVNLKTGTAKGEGAPVASFSVKLPPLPAYGSKDVSAAIDTKLRAYELPDWQFLRAEFQINTPIS